MPIQIAFWVLMILWLVIHFVIYRIEQPPTAKSYVGIFILIWILLFLLGWKVFGFVLQG